MVVTVGIKEKLIQEILKNLKPLLAKIMVLNYKSQRKLATNEIKAAAKALGIACEDFKGVKKGERYLVFGSFVLVEHFLRDYVETKKI